MLDNKQKEELKKKIVEKIPTLRCPMCNNNGFSMSDGYFMNNMQVNLNSIELAGQAIPAIGIICNNCGFISQHAIGALDLLPKTNNENEPK